MPNTGLYGLSTADDDDKDKEGAVSLKEVPDSVKATMLVELLREVKGLELEEIERATENGKVVYEGEFEYRDTEIELDIDANGKLLSKEVSREDDDGDDDGEDDDDDD